MSDGGPIGQCLHRSDAVGRHSALAHLHQSTHDSQQAAIQDDEHASPKYLPDVSAFQPIATKLLRYGN